MVIALAVFEAWGRFKDWVACFVTSAVRWVNMAAIYTGPCCLNLMPCSEVEFLHKWGSETQFLLLSAQVSLKAIEAQPFVGRGWTFRARGQVSTETCRNIESRTERSGRPGDKSIESNRS